MYISVYKKLVEMLCNSFKRKFAKTVIANRNSEKEIDMHKNIIQTGPYPNQ